MPLLHPPATRPLVTAPASAAATWNSFHQHLPMPACCLNQPLPLLTHCNPSPSLHHRHREESASLLDRLITSAPRLILPYVSPIQKALVSKLRGSSAAMAAAATPALPGLNILGSSSTNSSNNKPDQKGGGETGVIKSVLSTLGQLSLVAGVCGRSLQPPVIKCYWGCITYNRPSWRHGLLHQLRQNLLAVLRPPCSLHL